MPFKKGNIPWIKGRKLTEEHKRKISEAEKGFKPWRYVVAGWNKGLKGVQISYRKGKKYPQILGEKNGMWKGDSVGIPALHRWVDRTLGKPNKCEHCKTTVIKRYHWANVSKKYKRDVKDWIRLCVPCHKKYDLERLKK